MSILSDDFTVDTGQITTSGYNGNPPTSIGTAVITGSQLVLTIPPTGGVVSYIGAQENAWTIATPDLFVWSTIGTPTFNPLAAGQANFANAIIKDANHWLLVECGFVTGSPNSLNVFVAMMNGGAQVTLANTSVNVATLGLPDKIGMGLVNNIATAWLSFSGTWRQVTTFGSGGNVDVSGTYDFTAPGALVGWNPGASFSQIFVPTSSVFACSFIQYIAPFSSPVTGVTVPNLVNDDLATATAAIIAANLIVCSVATQASMLTPGTVISQTPAASSSVGLGTCVNLIVAAPPSTQTVNLQPKFVPAKCFLSLMVASPGNINPRVYPPHEDTTVRVIPRTIT